MINHNYHDYILYNTLCAYRLSANFAAPMPSKSDRMTGTVGSCRTMGFRRCLSPKSTYILLTTTDRLVSGLI